MLLLDGRGLQPTLSPSPFSATPESNLAPPELKVDGFEGRSEASASKTGLVHFRAPKIFPVFQPPRLVIIDLER